MSVFLIEWYSAYRMRTEREITDSRSEAERIAHRVRVEIGTTPTVREFSDRTALHENIWAASQYEDDAARADGYYVR